MDPKPPKPFENLNIRQRDLNAVAPSRYRVYKDATHFILVEAENALSALQASGLKQAQRIEREMLKFTSVLNLESLPQAEIKATKAEAPAAVEETPAKEQAAEAEAMAENAGTGKTGDEPTAS